jgi:hypothetical protein
MPEELAEWRNVLDGGMIQGRYGMVHGQGPTINKATVLANYTGHEMSRKFPSQGDRHNFLDWLWK